VLLSLSEAAQGDGGGAASSSAAEGSFSAPSGDCGERGCSSPKSVASFTSSSTSSSRSVGPSAARKASMVNTGFKTAAAMHETTSCRRSDFPNTDSHMADPTMVHAVDTVAIRELHIHTREHLMPMAERHGDRCSVSRWLRCRSNNQRGGNCAMCIAHKATSQARKQLSPQPPHHSPPSQDELTMTRANAAWNSKPKLSANFKAHAALSDSAFGTRVALGSWPSIEKGRASAVPPATRSGPPASITALSGDALATAAILAGKNRRKARWCATLRRMRKA